MIYKLLFLGSGESGKSTFFRQMQICHGAGFSESDLRTFAPVVYSNTISCMRTLIKQSKILGESDVCCFEYFWYARELAGTVL